jgi:hypothetical protein
MIYPRGTATGEAPALNDLSPSARLSIGPHYWPDPQPAQSIPEHFYQFQKALPGIPNITRDDFLNECFTEFNTTIESGNPLEKSVENFLALTPMVKIPRGSLAGLAAALRTPRGGDSSPSWNQMRLDALDTPYRTDDSPV